MSRLKVFLSFASEDKVTAGQYKVHLEKYYGFQVFVAHEDNVPSCDWDPEIEENISSSDIFTVLISEKSKTSPFVNQEIGMAIGKGLRIFPIKIDNTDPFGFIYKIHGFPYIRNPEEAVLKNGSKLFSILTSGRREFKAFGNIAIESAIYALSKSPNFSDTNIIIKTLIETEAQHDFNKLHLNQIKAACLSNYEIYGGAFAYPQLHKLLTSKYNVKGLRDPS